MQKHFMYTFEHTTEAEKADRASYYRNITQSGITHRGISEVFMKISILNSLC